MKPSTSNNGIFSNSTSSDANEDKLLKAFDAMLAESMAASAKLEDEAKELEYKLKLDPNNKELQQQLSLTYTMIDAYEDESDHIASHMFARMGMR